MNKKKTSQVKKDKRPSWRWPSNEIIVSKCPMDYAINIKFYLDYTSATAVEKEQGIKYKLSFMG